MRFRVTATSDASPESSSLPTWTHTVEWTKSPTLWICDQASTIEPDRLDMQTLADAYVADMDNAEISDVFGDLTEDWEAALAHAGHPEVEGRTTCPVEGELPPCQVLRGLTGK